MSPRHSLPPQREPSASMTLLDEVYRRPLDPGYREAARRRQATGAPAPVGRGVSLLLAALLGLAVTAAAVDLRRPEPGAVQARTLLEEEIAAQQARAAQARSTIRTTTAQLERLHAAALADEDPALLARLRQDQARSGVVPVTGPGVRIVLTDAADVSDPSNRVQDVDLRVVVNALWAGGAEAVAVNGARLTSLTAIRSAGSAVLVDLQPLTSPYTVEAVGDPDALSVALAGASAGQHLTTLRSTYGIGVQVSVGDNLSLPGTGQVTLRYASDPDTTEPLEESEP
ncbi:MAG: DUF881 domain-containing protein [Micrococcales bacterium]|nr:DUF881 domain-containing protein [Micrococcales bacterium]